MQGNTDESFSKRQILYNGQPSERPARHAGRDCLCRPKQCRKSSAINTLTNHVRLAYVSKTPGRTQHINFFELENGNFMVDLPGYGYAQVPEAIRAHWVKLLGDYLQQRRQLIGLILIMDSRHPLKALDIQMLDFFHITGRPVHILLSKADKLSKNDQIKTLAAVKKSLKPYTDRQKISVQLFSSLKKQGMGEVNQVVGSWFDAHREEIENLAGETSPE